MFFKRENKTNQTILKSLLLGIVDASMSAVDVGLLTSKIRKSAVSMHELVSTIASASEEMLCTVQGIAQNASDASVTAERVGDEARDASSVMESLHVKMENTTECMSRLKGASEKIEHVVKTINEITEQTNLLALNASIEAARAGEAGKGFAVVADEVRKLATQSQTATSEISSTISEIQNEVGNVFTAVSESQTSVNDGGEKVEKLSTSSEEIRNLMQTIAHSTKEQSEASQQISNSILEVSDEADSNEKQTADIMNLLDNLVDVIEKQRTLLSEQEIEGKVTVLAQADHALWKKKIVDFEMGRVELDSSAIGDHTTCRLGKWYYSDGSKEYKNNADFKEMEASHKCVHDVAKIAVDMRANQEGADISGLVEELESASVEVIASLKKL